MKTILTVMLFLALFAAVFSGSAFAASRVGYYTITLPADTATTMGDSSFTMPITVNNLATSTGSIAYVRLEFNTSIYDVSLSGSPPSGWTLANTNNGEGHAFVLFTTTTTPIAPGGSQTFTVTLTGRSATNIFSAASDQTDTLDYGSNRTVMTVGPSFNNNYFDKNATGNADTWKRKALYSSISATPASIGSGGTITVIQTVVNRSNTTLNNVQPVGNPTITTTGTAGATLLSGPAPSSVASMAAGASETFTWTYTASGSGSLQFCNSARNGTSTATSKNSCSGYVAVGDFTAYLTVTPSQIVNGQSVTVTMTVTNNGSASIHNIRPTLNPPAGSTNVSGPTPASIGNLAGGGASSTFQWVYTLTGSVGTTFTFSGYARDQNDTGQYSLPNPTYSNQVVISAYSVSVSPTDVPSGSANVTLAFTVINNGGYPLRQIKITSPNTSFVYNAASGGCSGAWTVTTGGTPTWTNFWTGADYVPVGGSCTFSVNYSSVPTVSSNTDYNFRLDIWDTQTPTNGEPRASLGVIVKITVYTIALVAGEYSLNPNCVTTLTATVSPDPGDGSIVNFLETAGTLDPHTSATTSAQAQSTLRAPYPYSASITSADVTASYSGGSDGVTITFLNGTACATGVRILDWREVIR
ncbi:MAG: NEW3 domain-containing protein [Thermodesulfovibrionales bacterium]|nr:NEW3 domain-containing protein [Thermodesulfovibrionales bacterium]